MKNPFSRLLSFVGLGGRKSTIATSRDLEAFLIQGTDTKSGQRVNAVTALQITAVMACVRVIADGLAQVPFRIMRKNGKKREPAEGHPLWDLITAVPNSWMTAYEFIETLAIHLVLTGNAYVYLVRTPSGVVEMLPLLPNRVHVELDGWEPVYTVQIEEYGNPVKMDASRIWHLKGPSWNTYLGMDAVNFMRETLGLAMSAESMASKMFNNGARPSGVLHTSADLDEEQLQQIRQQWKESYEGSENAFKTVMLYGDWKFEQMTQNAQEAELGKTRAMQVEEICRGFRVMPIMIGYSNNTTTYASAEQMFLAHVVHTMTPWYARIEQSANAKLLTPQERKSGYYFKFFAQGLMRGDMQQRSAFYSAMITSRIMNPNECRELEDLNPYEGGDEFANPATEKGPPGQAAPQRGTANPPKDPENGGAPVPGKKSELAAEYEAAAQDLAVAMLGSGAIADALPAVIEHKVHAAVDGLIEANARLFDWLAKEWREEDHPRAPAGTGSGGQFVAAGEGGANLSEADRERLRALKVPPGWTDVRLNPDPEGAVQVRARDAKGRVVSIRRAEADEAAAAEKYARLQDFTKAVPRISEAVDAKLADPAVAGRERDTAAVLKLIEHTGFRVGGDGDTGAEKQAYGASTLRKEHVRVDGDVVHFAFTGKKGVSITKELHNPQIARIIEDRLANAQGDRLFNTSDSHVIAMLREVSGNDSFKTKDFRTWQGTSKAVEVMATIVPPTSKKEYDKAVLAVSKAVAAHLGNTPAVAKASYINPHVWSVWQGGF